MAGLENDKRLIISIDKIFIEKFYGILEVFASS